MKQSVLIVAGLLAALPGFATDGATPIWVETAIHQPGRYVVTRDISTAGTAIAVHSDGVTLDLNGFTVESTGQSAIWCPSPCVNVEIRGGTVKSGAQAALDIHDASHVILSHNRVESPETGIAISSGTQVTISDNQIDAPTGVNLGAGNSVTISRNHVNTSYIGVFLSGGEEHHVHRNVIQFDGGTVHGVMANETRNTEISENVITGPETILNFAFGIYAGNSSGCLIRDNRIEVWGAGLEVGTESLVRNNAVAGRGG